jgi:hypothetical protein
MHLPFPSRFIAEAARAATPDAPVKITVAGYGDTPEEQVAALQTGKAVFV